MTRRHNIVACEASLDGPERRLAHFSHVHGGMAWGGPPRRRRFAATAITFLAGALTVLALGAALAHAH